MTVRILSAHETAIPITERSLRTYKPTIRTLVEDTDWDQEILKQERWIDLCCWSIVGFSSLYLSIVCVKVLIG